MDVESHGLDERDRHAEALDGYFDCVHAGGTVLHRQYHLFAYTSDIYIGLV